MSILCWNVLSWIILNLRLELIEDWTECIPAEHAEVMHLQFPVSEMLNVGIFLKVQEMAWFVPVGRVDVQMLSNVWSSMRSN